MSDETQPATEADSSTELGAESQAPETSPKPISLHLDSFINKIDSLAETLPLAMVAISRARKDSHKTFDAFVAECCEFKEDAETLSVPVDRVSEFERLRKRLSKAAIASESVPRSFLVALVSDYDAYLSGLLRILFAYHPEALNATEKNFSYSDLISFESIDAVREFIIEKRIENVLRDSHAAQFVWLEGKFSLPLKKELASWPHFIELTERRNLFVHNDGVVNQQYLDVCKEHGVTLEDGVSKGSKLRVTPKYFRHAHAIIFEIASKLAHVLWRKVAPGEREDADRHLAGSLIYELIYQERFELAAVMADFAADTFKKFSSDYNRKMLAVNHAQAHKWIGNASKCAKILDSHDWSAARDEFQLCVAALRDDVPGTISLMKTIGKAERPGKAGYREWPIFKELRKNGEFQEAFDGTFGEPLNIVKAEDNVQAQAAAAPPSETDVVAES